MWCKNSKVSVVEVDYGINLLLSNKIPNISNFHSSEFNENGMRFWNYADIGEGKSFQYGDTEFQSGLKVVLDFKCPDKFNTEEPNMSWCSG